MRSIKTMFFVLAMSLFAVGSFAQSPISQGEFLVGAASADTEIASLSLSPSVGYAMTDQIVLGVSYFNAKGGDWQGSIFGRYYLSSPFFAQVSAEYESEGNDMALGITGGVTGFIADWLYVEPNIAFVLADQTNLNLQLNFGLRF